MNLTLAQQSRRRRIAAAAAFSALALTFSGCVTVNVPPRESGSGATSPSASGPHGDNDFPATGIPTEVRWATDWLEGFASEGNGVRGEIVAIDLDFENDEWIWEVTSRFPSGGPTNTTPERGYEAELAADSLTELRSREVTLDSEEQEHPKIGIAEAARISGDTYPSPRLISLSLERDRGSLVWEATLLDSETLAETELAIDATTGEIRSREAD
ncbi:PepSY domain-containing protein [Leucobacter chromiireducens]|uniref:PepSY domain-containing protein n=1 Tax=Leucobacter chromiireducens TaxID=283877 RepID=UPI003F808D57